MKSGVAPTETTSCIWPVRFHPSKCRQKILCPFDLICSERPTLFYQLANIWQRDLYEHPWSLPCTWPTWRQLQFTLLHWWSYTFANRSFLAFHVSLHSSRKFPCRTSLSMGKVQGAAMRRLAILTCTKRDLKSFSGACFWLWPTASTEWTNYT